MKIIEKKLKILDIIIKKRVNVNRLINIINKNVPWYTYNLIQDTSRHLTESEFVLLREIINSKK